MLGFEGHDRAKKDAALDPVRSRDDFKKLMARLAELSKGAEWLTDLEAAKRQAAAEGKDLFIYFSGSDWCPWCLLLKRTVFDRPAFARYAARNFVLLQLDNPQRSRTAGECRRSRRPHAQVASQRGSDCLPG